MHQKYVRWVLAVVLVAPAVYGCSVKGIQSPIVLRSPVVLEETETQAPSESPEPSRSPAKTEAAGGSTRVEPRSAQAPADIVLLDNDDLTDSRLSALARIYISIPVDEFTEERAVQALKVEAFERFGSVAYGIANIVYRKKASLMPGNQGRQEVSADVITLSQKGGVPQGGEPGSPQGAASIFEDRPGAGEQAGALSLENIRILTPDDLYHLNFRIVGRVSVRDRSKKGYTREEALRALKGEATKNYGMQAMGLSNVKLARKGITYYYEKSRRSLNLTERGETYMKASADVVFWDKES